MFYRTPAVDETERLTWGRRQLVKAAQLLAVGPEGYAVALPDFVHVPDELRLVWDDSFVLALQVQEAGLISGDTFRLAASVDEAIKSAPVVDDYDAAMQAVAKSPEWEVVRDRARMLAVALGVEVRPPDLRAGYVQ